LADKPGYQDDTTEYKQWQSRVNVANEDSEQGDMHHGESSQGERILLFFQLGFSIHPIGSEGAMDIITNLPEHLMDLLFRALGLCGIRERPVMAVHLARKIWAGPVCIVTHSDYGLHLG